MRYVKAELPLRSGIFGTVCKSVNMDMGSLWRSRYWNSQAGEQKQSGGTEELEFFQVLKRGGNSYSG
jgi:hypothetical protein